MVVWLSFQITKHVRIDERSRNLSEKFQSVNVATAKLQGLSENLTYFYFDQLTFNNPTISND